MIQVPKYIVAIVGLSIIITLQQVITSGNFKVLAFFLWVSSVALVIHLILLGIRFFTDNDFSENSFLRKIFLASKIVIGFGFCLSSIIFCINLIVAIFDPWESLSFKLFVPFTILFIIGRIFLKEEEVNTVIRAFVAKWTPILKEWLTIVEVYANKIWQWALARKWLVSSMGLVLLLLFTLPSFFKKPEKEPQLVKLFLLDTDSRFVVENDSTVINRDYDQRLHLRVDNESLEMKHVYFEVIQESGRDSLMLGFVGNGSHYEDEIKTQSIKSNYSGKIDLLVHSAQAQDSIYNLRVKLFEADSINTKSTKLIEEKTIAVMIHKGEINIEFVKISEEPFSLTQTYQIINKGTLISDFSLVPEREFSEHIRIQPQIANYRLDKVPLTFTVEPKLQIGFDSIKGKLSGVSGMSPKHKVLPLSFKAPQDKTLFLALSDCGSNSTTRICECTNQRRTRVEVSTPSENDGPYIPPGRPSGRRPGTVDPPITWPPPPDTNDPQPPDDDHDHDEELEILPPVDQFSPYDSEFVTKDQILSDLNALKVNLEVAKGEFDDPGIHNRILQGLDKISMIEGYLNEVEGNYPPQDVVNRVNEDKPQIHEIFGEVVGHQSNNRARTAHNEGRPNLNSEESINLRVDGKVASLNNAGVPTIYNTPKHSHFAWHEPGSYKDSKQRVYYSRHSSEGPIEITQKEMNLPSEPGRWPFVIQGEKDNLFYIWQGGANVKNSDVFFRNSIDNGKTWSKTKNLSNHAQGVFAPRLSYNKGNLYAYWIDKSNNGSNLRVAVSSDNGNSFENPVQISRYVKSNGVVKMIHYKEAIYFLYEVLYNYNNTNVQKVNIVCHKVDSNSILTGEGSTFENNIRRINEGTQPAGIIDKNNDFHIAYIHTNDTNQYQLNYNKLDPETLMLGTNLIGPDREILGDQDYRLSPSLVTNNKELTLYYHVGKRHHGQFIDHLQTEKLNLNTGQWDKKVHRLPSLSTNAEKLFLSVQFDLPWSRSVYDKHNVKILINGLMVAHLKNTIPEGKMLFPVPSYILKYDGDRINKVTLETEHFNPAAYLAASEIKLISDLSFVEQFVYANSQEEADKLLYSRKEFNHIQPDLGFYSTVKTEIPEKLKDGDTLMLNIDLWNLGQGKSTESRIDIYGTTFKVQNHELTEGNLYKQIDLGTIKPFEKQRKQIPVIYWSGIEKIVVKVTSKEKDFDPSNNYFTTVLVNPNDNLHIPTSTSSLLRVAVFDAPGILAENMTFELTNSSNARNRIELLNNPAFWRPEPGIYNIKITSEDHNNFEQTITGIPIKANFDIYNNPIPSQNISLDIQLKNQDKLVDELNANNDGSVITFQLPGELLFAVNETNINEFAEDNLRKVIYLMSSYPKSTLKIVGHTDSQGNLQDNMDLSNLRALTVAEWLATNGNFDSKRFNINGVGSADPVATNETEEGRAKNRRVNFSLILNN